MGRPARFGHLSRLAYTRAVTGLSMEVIMKGLSDIFMLVFSSAVVLAGLLWPILVIYAVFKVVFG